MALVGNGDADFSDGSQGIQSVELAMNVLRAIEDAHGPRSLKHIANAAGMTPSKAHRYLVSLGRVGLVSQSHRSGLYDLGSGLRRLGIEALRRMDEVAETSEYLPGLRDRTMHAVNLAVWGDHGPVIVRWDYGAFPLPVSVRVGTTMPLLDSSVGRVYLAYLPEAVTGPILREQLADEEREHPTERTLRQIVTEVKKLGYARTAGTMAPGVTNIAAPVFAFGDSLPLVISVAVGARYADPTTLRMVTDELLATTELIERDYGSRSSGPAN